MRNLKEHRIEIVIIILIQFVMAMYSLYIVNTFAEKNTTQYHLDQSEYTELTIESGETADFQIQTTCDKLLVARVSLDITGCTEGNVEYKVQNEDGDAVTEGQYSLEELQYAGGLNIDLSQVNNTKMCVMRVSLESHLNQDLKVYLMQDGYADLTETYSANYAAGIKYILIALHIIVLILSIIFLLTFKVEYKFLIMALVVGLLSVFAVIPCNAPDEWRHFARAYDIAAGKNAGEEITEVFDSKQKVLACSMPKEYLEIKNLGQIKNISWEDEYNWNISIPKWISLFGKNVSEEKVVIPMLATSGKASVEYLPQVLFILMAFGLKLSPIAVFYMARIGNMLIATLLAFLAIKIIPCYKHVLACIFFMPCMTWLRGTCSTDGFLFSLILLLIAYIMNIKEKKITIWSWKQIAWFVFLGTYIAIIKLPYLLFLLLLWIVDVESPVTRFSRRKSNVVYLTGLLIVCMVLRTIAFKLFISPLHVSGGSMVGGSVLYMLRHPVSEVSLLVRYFIDSFGDLLSSAIAWPMGGTYYIWYLLLLIVACIFDRKAKLSFADRKYIVGIAIIMWAAIVFVGYAAMSAPGATEITGIQGRYMSPFIILFIVGIIYNKIQNTIKLDKYMPMFVLTCNILFFIKYFGTYWIP